MTEQAVIDECRQTEILNLISVSSFLLYSK